MLFGFYTMGSRGRPAGLEVDRCGISTSAITRGKRPKLGDNTQKPIRSIEHDFLSERATARWLGFAPQTLKKWRCRGEGPPYHKIGKRAVRYRAADVADWIASQSKGVATVNGR